MARFLPLLLIALTAPALAQFRFIPVIDGDTFMDGQDRIRLWGMDAPEAARDDRPAEPCADEATLALSVLLSQGYRCEIPPSGQERDGFGSLVRQCWTTAGVDIGGEIVWRGLAVDVPDYSRGEYADEQDEARDAGRGMWGECDDAVKLYPQYAARPQVKLTATHWIPLPEPPA